MSIINLICACFGSFDDWRNERTVQNIITINYQAVTSNILLVLQSNGTELADVYGLDNYTISTQIVDKPIIKKRIKIARTTLIAVPVVISVAIAIALTVYLVSR